MNTVYLLLGSNLGNRQLFLEQARKILTERVGAISSQSAVYETASWGKADEPSYLNQVLSLQTTLPPYEVLRMALDIEQELGRERLERWGSRTLDIDILYYNDLVLEESPDLIIPHPRLHERRFALEPLAEIAPDFKHPVLKQTNYELKCMVKDELEVKKI
ncbi:2-amino-4-hydroxy-6-hydroxymethyldihydropteridine diphosphokinase [Mucilaginibacter robiniae]|uniref:2-amino-4-hydroxy-6-hydroxymethyldihydropteridine pyrophosphokinase n=1 Tax=Mucilaginibacter robiniae TaxID=2728022 RepID=A0A7L5E301_9SPHI|nr:2-amino-4-hydroxy-6-hydroxymethyldihydropteridine diphosphokinase [Mucilaginibacter robiniae]QJD97505.1 2-amino-4-hydroxy-6-hydroxymethyldihydropteridine diphosphokinase [Mucilaginibacter robiniae]